MKSVLLLILSAFVTGNAMANECKSIVIPVNQHDLLVSTFTNKGYHVKKARHETAYIDSPIVNIKQGELILRVAKDFEHDDSGIAIPGLELLFTLGVKTSTMDVVLTISEWDGSDFISLASASGSESTNSLKGSLFGKFSSGTQENPEDAALLEAAMKLPNCHDLEI